MTSAGEQSIMLRQGVSPTHVHRHVADGDHVAGIGKHQMAIEAQDSSSLPQRLAGGHGLTRSAAPPVAGRRHMTTTSTPPGKPSGREE